jgi:uncharacterized membrane protein YqhA
MLLGVLLVMVIVQDYYPFVTSFEENIALEMNYLRMK